MLHNLQTTPITVPPSLGGGGGGLQDREAKKDQHHQGNFTQNDNQLQLLSHPSGHRGVGGGGNCKTERLKRTNISRGILHKTTINCSYCPTLQDKGGGGGGELQDREAKKDQHQQGHVTQPTANSNYCYTFTGGGGGGGATRQRG